MVLIFRLFHTFLIEVEDDLALEIIRSSLFQFQTRFNKKSYKALLQWTKRPEVITVLLCNSKTLQRIS